MRILFTFLVLTFVSTIGFSQTSKMEEKAKAKVEQLNQLISGENPEAALTDDQKAKIFDLYLQRFVDIKKINKSDLSDEEKKAQKKAIYRKVGKTINKEVLTKEQIIAKKNARKKKKENKNKN